MTVLLDDGASQPGTHVLIIGVGAYAFLKGGKGAEFKHHMSMGQLSSPPESAAELTEWFLDAADGFHNPDRPLRSLQLLCSSDEEVSWPAPGGGTPVERATTANVKKAIAAWVSRASRDEDNLALFYFCGHGLSFGQTQNSLLLEGWGENILDPMSDALAFDEMRLGLMQQCKARHQCHFVDACRSIPTKDYREVFGTRTGEPVVAGGVSSRIRNKIAPVYFATGLASAAYGLDKQPSLFAQGLLLAFRGAASRDADDHWDVSVSAMAEGINKGVESLSLQTQPQYCQPLEAGQSLLLHRLRRDPEVIVKVWTRDETLLGKAVLAYTSAATTLRKEREPRAVPWWVPLPLGSYDFEALTADNLANVIGKRTKNIAPPSAEVRL